MDPAQFAQFIQAEQADRQAVAAATLQQHQERQAALQEAEERLKATQQANSIRKCDGLQADSLRDWFREIDFSIPYSAQTVFIATQTAVDGLKCEIERFLAAQANRNAVTWAQLKTHIQGQFLSQHEAEKLKDAVEKVKQTPYETAMQYGRRFQDAADLGYPPAGRNADQERELLKSYTKGLRDRHIVERLVREGRPADFTAAMALVQQYESDEYKLHKALGPSERQEEPMEIGMQSQAAEKSELAELKRQVSGMTGQLTKLIAAQQRPSAQRSPRHNPQTYNQPDRQPSRHQRRGKYTYKWTPDGAPICYNCLIPGHKGRACWGKPAQAPVNRSHAQGGV